MIKKQRTQPVIIGLGGGGGGGGSVALNCFI